MYELFLRVTLNRLLGDFHVNQFFSSPALSVNIRLASFAETLVISVELAIALLNVTCESAQLESLQSLNYLREFL